MSSSNEVLHPATLMPAGFRIAAVPEPGAPRRALTGTAPLLGPLAAFTGTFGGAGFNTIFRPDGNPRTPMPGPVTSTDPRDNVLELNLTAETLSFGSPLGSVPNRGSSQSDAFLDGVSYTQSVTDVTTQVVDPTSPGTPIHLEPGLWMAIPAAGGNSVASVARMASIPHGTTVNAQGAFTTHTGPPTIPPVSITPFFIAGGPVQFQSQQATNSGTARIPQNLAPYIAAGRITQAMLDDPNTFLRNHIAGQNIVETTTISISTTPTPVNGSGTDNIDFLMSNADAVEMNATFWIETVEHDITIPFPIPHPPLPQPLPPLPPAPGPRTQAMLLDRAHLNLPPVWFQLPEGLTEEITLRIRFTQIQYSQTVMLNFGPLTWPHVSVATLTPQHIVPLPVGGW